jgi:hypothetical protein
VKRFLLATICVGALVSTNLRPARAQFAVVCVNCGTEFTQILSWAKALLNEARQIALATQQLEQLYLTYQAVTGVRSIGGALSAMSMLGIQNPLPIDPYALQNIISGAGGPTGMVASLAALYTGNRAVNTVYTPGATDWSAQQMIASGNSLAGTQTLVQRLFQASGDRLQQLVGLRTRLASATDPKDIWDLQAQIAAAQSDMQAQHAQATHISTLAQMQPQVFQQQSQEYARQDVCRYIAFLRTNEDGLAPAPNCGSVSPTTGSALLPGAGFTQSGGTMPFAQNAGAIVPGATVPGTGTTGPVLDRMMAQPWGQSAADNAQALGVNPEALAATCAIESNCRNVAGPGSVSGAFQMTDSTYATDIATARALNPSLQLDTSLAGKMNPANEAAAAAVDLRSAALNLQALGIANPSILDVRGSYNFGAAYTGPLATAPNDRTMASVLTSYGPDVLANNGIAPGMTVGQWRQGLAQRLGAAADAPVLLAGE